MKEISEIVLGILKRYKKIVILCQILFFFLIIGFITITSKKTEYVSGTQMQLNSGHVTTDGEAYIDSKDPYVNQFAKADFNNVGKGFYLIKINYRTGYNDNGVFITSSNPDYGSINPDIGNTKKTVQLKAYRSQITIHVWLNEKAEVLSTNFHYCGGGYVGIKSVQLKQVPDYTVALVFCLIMLVMDVLVYQERLKQGKKEQKIVFAGLFLIVFVACIPLMNDFLIFAKDLNFHLSRIEGIREGLLAGQFPVKIEPQNWNEYGFGAPFFYPDLFLYFPAILMLCGYGLQTAYKCYVIAITVLTAGFSYYSFSKIIKSKYLGLAGSGLYTLSIYRFADVFDRSMVGAFSAYAFFPLIILGLFKIYSKDFSQNEIFEEKQNRGWIILALGLTGCLQTHILSCEMVGIFMMLFFVVFIKDTLKKKVIISLLKSLILFIVLNLWFLTPFLQIIKGDYVVNSGSFFQFMIQNQGAYISQIFALVSEAKGAPVGVGLSLGLGILCFIVLLYTAYDTIKTDQKIKYECHIGILFCVLSLVAVFMATNAFPYDWLYRKNKILKYFISHIQFPWRFLNIATPFMVIVTLIAAKILWKYAGRFSAEIFLSVLMVITLISMGSFYYVIMDQETEYFRCQDYQADPIVEATDDYLLNSTASDKLDNLVKTSGQEISISQYDKMYTNVQLTCRNAGAKEGYIEVPLFLYPCYQAKDAHTGKIMNLTYGDNNTIRIAIPPSYSGTIKLHVHERLLWRAAEAVSLFSYLGLGVLLWIQSGRCRFLYNRIHNRKQV